MLLAHPYGKIAKKSTDIDNSYNKVFCKAWKVHSSAAGQSF